MTMQVRDPDEVIESMAVEVIELSSQVPVKIETEEQFLKASELWKVFSSKEKEYERAFDLKKKPVRELLNSLQAEFTGKVKPLREATAKLKPLLTYWQARKEQQAAEQQRKAIERHDARVEKAVAAGKDPENIAPPKVIAPPATAVHTESGTMGFSSVMKWRWKTDPSVGVDTKVKPDVYRKFTPPQDFPDEFWLLDWAKVTKAVKAGVGVPDCIEVYI